MLVHLTLYQRSDLPTTSRLSRKNSEIELKDYRIILERSRPSKILTGTTWAKALFSSCKV